MEKKKFWPGILVCLLFFGLLCGCQKQQPKETPFLSINGEEVREEEYVLYLEEAARNFQELGGEDIWETDFDGRSALDVAKDSALNSLIAVKVTAQQADEMGISLSEEEEAEAKEEADDAVEAYEAAGDVVSEETKEALDTVMVEKQLFQKVKQAVVSSYAIGEAEFQAYATAYRDSKEAQMRQLTIYSIGCTTEEAATAAYDALQSGAAFAEIFAAYNEDPSLSVDVPYEVEEQDLEEEEKVLSGVGQGFVSKPMLEGDYYYVLSVGKVEEASQEEVTQALREEFTQIFQNQVFEENLQKWQQNAVIEQNMTLWQQISAEEMHLMEDTKENE